MDMPDLVFIGLAHWHVPMHVAAARRAGLRILGGWDPDPALAQVHGLPAFGTPAAAFATGAGLAVVTGTPLEMPDRVRLTVAAGIPLLVEKPVAPTGAALRPLADEVTATGAFAAVALPHHAGPLATATGCGSVRHLSVRLVNGRPARYRDWGVPWVLDPAVGGGGALRNLGVHGIDLARLLLGSDVAVTSATLRRWHGEAVEDHAVVHLAAPSGATATVEAGYLHPDDGGSDFEARLMGSDAVAVDTGEVLLVSGPGGLSERRPVTPQPSRYDDLMADVARRVQRGLPPAASLADLAGAMDLIDAAYHKAQTP
jgi:predicted dehydrogenase